MKNLLALFVLAVGFISNPAQAQEDDTLRVSVNGTDITIITDDLTSIEGVNFNGMIRRFSEGMQKAASEFQAEMAEIDRQEEAGEITAEEAEERREVASERFEEKAELLAEEMEEWTDQMEDQMEREDQEWETWAKQWEDGDSLPEPMNPPMAPTPPHKGQRIIITEDGIRIEDNEVEEEIIIGEDPCEHCDDDDHYTQNEFVVGFHVGWNTMYNDDFQLSSGGAEVKFFDSWAYDLEFGHKVRLGSTSPFLFYYGMNFSWHNIETRKSLVKFEDVNGVPSAAFQDRTDISNISETEFDIVYWDIPMMFILDLSGDDFDDSFTLGLGGYGGVRIGSERETTYTDFRQDEIDEDIDDNFLSNQFRYGLMGQIGWGSFKVTAKYDLNQLFQSEFNTPNYHVASVTLGLVF